MKPDRKLVFRVLDAVGRLPKDYMPPAHRHLMIRLADHAGTDDRIFPSLSKLAEETGIHRSTIARYLTELEASGWIKRERVRSDRTGWDRTNYQILFDGGKVDPCRTERPGVVAPGDHLDETLVAPGDDPSRSVRHEVVAPGDDPSRRARHDPLRDPRNGSTQGSTHPAFGGLVGAGAPTRYPAAGQVDLFQDQPETAPTESARTPRRGGRKEPQAAPRPPKPPKGPTADQRYRAAYEAGVRSAAPDQRFSAPPRLGLPFADALKVHAVDRTGAPLRGDELDAWIARTAADFRRDTADEGRFFAWWAPSQSGFVKWLNAGGMRRARSGPGPAYARGPIDDSSEKFGYTREEAEAASRERTEWYLDQEIRPGWTRRQEIARLDSLDDEAVLREAPYG